MKISSNFDSGNIECLSAKACDDIQLAIRKDAQSDFYQWFHFRLTGAQGEACVLSIGNAGESAYPGGWESYQAVASYDRETWFRVPTDYENGCLRIQHTPEYDSVYYAYFAPYSLERHADLISDCQFSSLVNLQVLGSTLDGRDIDMLTIGTPGPAKKTFWAIARQHPGESMAEWWMEGFLDRLLNEDDASSRALLERATIYVVPNMNPDGSIRGHLRTNAVGANLNREWLEPSLESSPEVFHVKKKMRETGVDFCFDVHGDEALPYNFIAGTEGVEKWDEQRNAVLNNFKQLLAELNPDFQTKYGYPVNSSGKANLSLCSNNVAHSFDCLAMTLEMPFKDTANAPSPVFGWSPDRSKLLGAACVHAMLAIEPQLW